MITVSLLTILAFVPIVVILLGIYYLLCWYIPKDLAYEKDKEKKNVLIAHLILLVVAWLIWSIYFFCEGKSKYIQNHPEITKVQEL